MGLRVRRVRITHSRSAPHGIQLDAVPVDAEQVRALPGDHMQCLLPPSRRC
jgi:hypothetical protein